MKLKKGIGSSFDTFLEEEGLLPEAEAVATKRVIAYQLKKSMEEKHLSKTEMAKKMNTSRSSLDRILDPLNESITLSSIEHAAAALGKRVKIELV